MAPIRTVTSATSLENLRREAKRWLKALRADDTEARARYERARPGAPPDPTLRDVQLALAREYGFAGWAELKARLASGGEHVLRELGAGSSNVVTPDVADWFLENACPDHHVRGGSDHAMASATAMRILDRYHGLRSFDVYTAIVSADSAETARMIADDPSLARKPRAASGDLDRSVVGGSGDRFRAPLGPKNWEPLLFLAFTRLPLREVSENAVATARALLDAGADPNAYFMAGGSRYTPLVGVVGEGEESRPPHPQRDALARLLLERGAEPYDMQVVYNIGFKGNVLWFLQLAHEFSAQAGRAADWTDPDWKMLDMGAYGSGARWHFEIAVRTNDLALATWMLAHGASPNAAAPADPRLPKTSLVERAIELGRDELADLFERHGASRVPRRGSPVIAFAAACFRLDAAEARRLARAHPELLSETRVAFDAIRRDRADVLRLLLDVGMSPDVEDSEKQRPLHIAANEDAIACGTLLVERGAAIDPVEANYENTPIDAAVYMQSERMIDLLAQHSRNLWNLVFVGATERVRALLAEDPSRARIASTDGWTPVMWLPGEPARAMEITELLLAHGADPSRVNSEGLTAADYAEKRALHEAAEVLRRHAAATTGR